MLSERGIILGLVEVEGSWLGQLGGTLVALKCGGKLFVYTLEVWDRLWRWWPETEGLGESALAKCLLFGNLLFVGLHSWGKLGKAQADLGVFPDSLVPLIFLLVDHALVEWDQNSPWDLTCSERSSGVKLRR